MNIITGYRGEPHITSVQDRAKNQGAFGTGSYILDVGNQMTAQIISANEVRIRDGVLCMQGCVANIELGAYDTCEISNGTQGMQRRDLIVARYTKDAETNIEDVALVVIEGTPASSSPVDPPYNTGNIQAGDSPVDFPLYRVNINGITISSTTKLASTISSLGNLGTFEHSVFNLTANTARTLSFENSGTGARHLLIVDSSYTEIRSLGIVFVTGSGAYITFALKGSGLTESHSGFNITLTPTQTSFVDVLTLAGNAPT